jgi:peptide deformylase
MTTLPIRTIGDPVLREPSADVEGFDQTLRKLAEDMFETMYAAPGVGLAASQVGLALRLFVFDNGQGSKGAIANPVLSERDGEQLEEEGCLSIPGLYFLTERAMRVRVDGRDLDGNPVSMVGEELLARIFQHEVDHVNGTLFIERLTGQTRRDALAALRERELGSATGGPGRAGSG